MDNLNYNQDEKRPGFFRRNSKTIKAITIGFLVLLLLIPMAMVKDLIQERNYTENEAIQEVSRKWSERQTITGPYLNFDYIIHHEVIIDGKKSISSETQNLILLPDDLVINGKLRTETRRRGIYDVNVYHSDLVLKGNFSSDELKKRGLDIENVQFTNVTICLGVTDMRGISEQIYVVLGDSVYDFESGLNGKNLVSAGVSRVIDIPELRDNTLSYEIKVSLKGSQAMFFTPIGKTTEVELFADWNTPSFDGSYLPETYQVTDADFTAHWKVLNLNRNYPQAFIETNRLNDVTNSNFGVNLKMPVEQYQQSMRTAKYAILIILLTFTIIYFVEIMDKKRIHALQYLLIGLALCLFYSLLLSMSEQMNFALAYIISSLLTIVLIGLYIRGIMKKKKPALIMSGLLAALYTYVFVLIQLETLALLAGSLGLFIILAILMYISKKIDWFGE